MKGRRFIYKRVLYYVIISLLALFALIPFFWMLSTSLKETNALTTIPIQWLPEKVSFSAYTELFTVFPFTRSILNSLFISVVGTFISVMSSAMAAYVFGKIEFKGREVLFTFYLATMMIPGNLLMIPNYLTLRSMGLLDSLVGVLLPSFFNAFGTFLLRQNIKSLPNSFIEAAVIDGASRIKVFFKIILPLVKPAVTTVTVLTFMGNWNAYLWPLIVLTSKENMTLTVGLSLLNGQYGTDYNLLMAGAIISIIPMIVVYAFSQKHIEVGFGDYFTKLMTLIAGNNAPDAFELNYENFFTYAKKGTLLNLNAEMAANNFNRDNLNEMALKAFQMNNDQYGLPFSFSNVVLIYNKALFDQAGVSYPAPDWKWNDVQNAAEKIRALHPMTFGLFQPIQFNEFYKVVQQNGGSLFTEDGKAFNVNSPENIETLQYMVDRILKSNVMPNDAQLAGMGDWDLFIAGRVGMLFTGIWAFPTFTSDCDFDWDIAVEPGNKAKATHFFSNGIAISKNTKVKDAAYKWIEFLSSSKEVAQIRIDAGWELPAVTYADILADYTSQTPPANRNAVFESMNYLVTPPVVEQAAELTDILNRYLDEARYGEKTPEEALNGAQKELTEKIKLD